MKKLGFGLMRLPLYDLNDRGSINVEKVSRMVDLFLSRGYTYFDTAWMYCGGKSEETANRVLVSRYPRNAFTLTSKLPDAELKTEADRDRVLSEQLRRTGAGFFDYYLLHAVSEENIAVFEGLKCFEWLLEKKAEGLVKKVGFSFHGTPELLDRLLTEYPFVEVVQLQINYLDWNDPEVRACECYAVCEKHGKRVIVMEPVKGGKLAVLPKEAEEKLKRLSAESSAASWGIRFAASLKNVMVVLSGMSTDAQILDNTAFMDGFVPLTEAEKQTLFEVADIIRRHTFIECTNCAYCMAQCPQHIRIPDLFSVYNDDKLDGTNDGRKKHLGQYAAYTSEAGVGDCLKCGLCEQACPQHLHIRELLGTVGDFFAVRALPPEF